MSEAKDFYVSMRRAERTAFLLGPFVTHAEAIALVDTASREAARIDPVSGHFDAFGTVSLPVGSGVVGKLNDKIGISANIRK